MFDNQSSASLNLKEECIYTFIDEDTHYIYGLAISPNGEKIVSANHKKGILIHDLNTGKIYSPTDRFIEQILAIAISPDGKFIATSGRGKFFRVKIWNLNTAEFVTWLFGRSDAIYSIAFSPDGKILAAGGSNKYKNRKQENKTTTIYLWNTQILEPRFDSRLEESIGTLSGHTLRINKLVFSPDSRILVSQSNDGTIKVWDLQSLKLLYTIQQPTIITGITISPDGEELLALGDTGIFVWDLHEGKLKSQFTKYSKPHCDLLISPDGNILLAGINRGIQAFKRADKQHFFYFDFYYPNTEIPGVTTAITLSKDGTKLVGCASFPQGGMIKVWKIPSMLQESNLTIAITKVKESGFFTINSIEDAREKINTSIVRRRGQPEFRKQLLIAYNNKCAVTGCDVIQALEAAHIYPYQGDETDRIDNGLLLRADIHTLFDLYQITIHPETKKVCLSPELQNSSYKDLNSKAINLPTQANSQPSIDALEWHYNQCKWTNS